MFEITLRELLLFQSLYVCKTLTDIVDIVNDQPNPQVFYKSFLELNGTNMTSILSFDSRSMQYLLKDEFAEHFSSEFPMFYRNKIQKGPSKLNKYFYRSAIDSALRNNQVRAVQEIISYIVKYQDNYVSSFLFIKNFTSLLDKGIFVGKLLNSQVFNYEFDLDEWPSTHNCNNEELRPYNENLFMLRKHYKTVFPEDEFMPLDEKRKKNPDLGSVKVYKIKYSLNMLPQIGVYKEKIIDPYTNESTEELRNEDINLLQQCAETENELSMFDVETLQDLIAFKWDAFGYKFHLFGCFVHLVYIIILFAYIDLVYIKGGGQAKTVSGSDSSTRRMLTFNDEIINDESSSLNLYLLDEQRHLKAAGGGAGASTVETKLTD